MAYKYETIRLPSYDTPLDDLLDDLREECDHARQWDDDNYDGLLLLRENEKSPRQSTTNLHDK